MWASRGSVVGGRLRWGSLTRITNSAVQRATSTKTLQLLTLTGSGCELLGLRLLCLVLN